MGDLEKTTIVSITSKLVIDSATKTANEQINAYIEANDNAMIDADIKNTVINRATSELLLRSSNFNFTGIETEDFLKTSFMEWFETSEKDHLISTCKSCLKEEIRKNEPPEEREMTFTEKYLKRIKEEGRHSKPVDVSSLQK